jgi:hypothetical protein
MSRSASEQQNPSLADAGTHRDTGIRDTDRSRGRMVFGLKLDRSHDEGWGMHPS